MGCVLSMVVYYLDGTTLVWVFCALWLSVWLWIWMEPRSRQREDWGHEYIGELFA